MQLQIHIILDHGHDDAHHGKAEDSHEHGHDHGKSCDDAHEHGHDHGKSCCDEKHDDHSHEVRGIWEILFDFIWDYISYLHLFS